MKIKVPQTVVTLLDRQIKEQRERVERTSARLKELLDAREQMEVADDDTSNKARGGLARAAAQTPERRAEIGRIAASARWKGKPRP